MALNRSKLWTQCKVNIKKRLSNCEGFKLNIRLIIGSNWDAEIGKLFVFQANFKF
jgi:hypothetical protein